MAFSEVGPHASAKVLRLYSTKAKPRECCVIWLTGMLISDMLPKASKIVRRSRTSLYFCIKVTNTISAALLKIQQAERGMWRANA